MVGREGGDGEIERCACVCMCVCVCACTQAGNLKLKATNSLVPRPPHVFNIHKKNQEDLVDFGDVMDTVCDDAHWNE